ncbi:HPr family phosphocarrier protein [Pelagibius litoralis]|uniref:HPr family phosphocarrier protein n=1 Tax=Pelagibius litoralis TaxID=374515 RepID=A0A967C447_9PROT|nr:HPr family phosphocarrier protein [Pelagibius litoralis]NIA68010.1 HPr family phosphocarrier protein [Pelagibius litoralis]
MDKPAQAQGIPTAETVRRRLTIQNQKGLHARAAAKFVKLAETFDAQITVIKNDTRVSGCSIMGLMMLAAGPGCDIDVEAEGFGAVNAVEALSRLIDDKFDEDG